MTLNENDQFKMDEKDELKQREDISETDPWSENQSTLPPKIDRMKDKKIEMTFEYPGVYGAKCLEWYQSKIIKATNETKFRVKMSGMEAIWPKATRNSVHISWCGVIGTLKR